MPDNSFDIIVIGSGPGGYVTAIRAAQLGFKTAIVERAFLGGICSNWGCIPTKALLRSAEIYHYITHAKDYGLRAENVSFDQAAVVKRSRGVAARMNSGVGFLMKKNKISVIWGEAFIDAPGQLTVKPSDARLKTDPPKDALGPGAYQAKHIIVATGARPRALPGLEPDGKLVWSYFEAMAAPKMPKSLLVIGSGAIGIEFASFYRTMGAEVTVVEVLPQLLPVEDAEIAAFARKQFEKQGIKIHTGTKVTKLDKKADSVVATLDDGKGGTQTIEAERVISAVGVVGNVENLGLEKLGVKIERRTIAIDGQCRTNVPGIYAIGDVAGPPMLAHKAEHEGVICVEAIKGLHPHPMDKSLIPGCTYCHPQIASVGLTEAKAKEQGRDIRVGRFPFVGNGKAIALGEDQGLVKVIFDKKTGQLLGAHLVGAEVTELIQGFVVAMNLETTEEELMHSIFPHPTISETMKEAVLDAYGRVLNM
jgi:dihydrolipoamide dehydrogenase